MERAGRATVRMTRLGGQGVLVPGGFILTAAHCVSHSASESLTPGDRHVEEVRSGSEMIFAEPVAVEPLLDIAALGSLDTRVFSREPEFFQDWCARTAAVPIATAEPRILEPFAVAVRSHDGRWIQGEARLLRRASPELALRINEPLGHGSSGGPIIDEAGLLVGIVAYADDRSRSPRPRLALPVWIIREIEDAQGADRNG